MNKLEGLFILFFQFLCFYIRKSPGPFKGLDDYVVNGTKKFGGGLHGQFTFEHEGKINQKFVFETKNFARFDLKEGMTRFFLLLKLSISNARNNGR